MYSEILARIRTEEEREGLVEELKGLKEALYKGGEFFEHELKTKVRYWASQMIANAIAQKEVDKEKYLQGLIGELANLKTLKLVLAFEPTDAAVQRCSEYIRGQVGERVVLDFTYLPGILGGAIIIFEGKYRDFSLRRVFEEELNETREAIFKKFSKFSIKT